MILLAASLFFYAWGEPKYILLMLASIVINYSFGLALAMVPHKYGRAGLLAACLMINLGL